jgi:hypothetical protein
MLMLAKTALMRRGAGGSTGPFTGFVAVTADNPGQVWVSSDALTWTSRTTGFTQGNATLADIVFSGTTYAFVGGLFDAQIFTSTDTITWTSRTTPAFSQMGEIVFGQSLFVCTAAGIAMITSSDGVTWTSRTCNMGGTLGCLIAGPSAFVAGGGSGRIFSSANGVTWTSRTSPFTGGTLGAGTFGNSIFVIAGVGTTSTATSSDGVTWTSRTMGAAVTINDIIWVQDDAQFVAVGTSGWIATSANGITWTSRTSQLGVTTLTAVAYGNGLYVIGTGSANKMTSSDGVTWTSRNAPSGSIPAGGMIYAAP